ncbi:MAG: hypothetical protein US11_C0005G0009 [Candidatus Roizmanbacteria bacterium GW2011_GWA2_36_23]|uniref:Glycosyltransferase 2-like domain-containing protein n=1 Tax=Candidatus Roizmanbacteria bacterium GW2011_GWA2_36_23 TaxID=1618480 RepID=A0A0G0E424_9BACT|nr:MAG: hypothetical protein US11_C0005G0009 [Candidatus Roizmanbacteria bacterium GW2011_GWA2_36_23]
MRLSIIIPVYFEEKNIIKVIERIRRAVKTPYTIFIVYDTEKDPTCKSVRNYQKAKTKHNIILLKNSTGNGKGVMNAIKTGFKNAKGEAVVITMADLCDDVAQIDKMFSLVQKGYDIICASRYMKGGRKIGGPLFKSFLSRMAGLTLHYFYKVPTHDSTNAFKMYRRKIFKKIKIASTGGFEYSLEIILKAYRLGYSITEIPTVWKDREAGKSNFKLLGWLPNYIRSYLYVFRKI